MSAQTVVTTELHVSASQPATHTASGFAALTFTEIAEITDMGEGGATLGFAEHSPLKTGVTEPLPAFVSFSERTVTMGYDSEDPGQIMLDNAINGSNLRVLHSFKRVLQSGEIEYFTGYIGSFTQSVPSGNSVVAATCVIRQRGVAVKVTPSA